MKQVLLGRSQWVRLDLCMQGTPAVSRLPGGVGCDGSRLTVSKHGLKSRFPELSEHILLRGEIPSFNRCGIPHLFNMKSSWEEERGSDPVPATGEFCRPNFILVQLCTALELYHGGTYTYVTSSAGWNTLVFWLSWCLSRTWFLSRTKSHYLM